MPRKTVGQNGDPASLHAGGLLRPVVENGSGEAPVQSVPAEAGDKPNTAAPNAVPCQVYLPTNDDVKGELWKIATGDGSDASRVSALRALADIMGLMRAGPPELPEAMSAYMDALAIGLSRPPEHDPE